jgi:PGF-pre-PGF domain-containing protein
MALVSSEPASNIAAKELSIMNVMAGYPVRFDFVKNVTCITYIEFNPKKTFRQTTTAVEELKNKSALVPTLPPGKIYKNVNIWVGDKGAGLPTSLENGSVDFKVNKTWIEENNVSEAMVTLQRYDKEWQPLSTEKVGEDKNYVYFKAKTPGYSFFAITEYTEQNGNSNGIPAEDKITETLKNLGAGNSIIKYPMRAARIIMAISLPLFMIIAGYCVLKKKI